LVGSVLDWNSASWNITSFILVANESMTSICQPYPNKTYVIFPELREIDSANSLCWALGKNTCVLVDFKF